VCVLWGVTCTNGVHNEDPGVRFFALCDIIIHTTRPAPGARARSDLAHYAWFKKSKKLDWLRLTGKKPVTHRTIAHLTGTNRLLPVVGHKFDCWLSLITTCDERLNIRPLSVSQISAAMRFLSLWLILYVPKPPSSIYCIFWYVRKTKIDYTFKLFDQYACVGHKLPDWRIPEKETDQ
jgi:hypothetical protein